MRSSSVSVVFSIAALSSSALAAVTMSIAKNPESIGKIRRRNLDSRAHISESLVNNFTGGDYIAKVTVGTPPQTITLAIDTGSSDVWVMSNTADLCTSALLQNKYQTGGCASTFDATKSSSFKVVKKGAFNISYEDGSGATGDYVTENLAINGAGLTALQMGIAYSASLPTGLLGIGYDANEASNSARAANPFIYPSIIDQMVTQNLIGSRAYSLYLDDLQSSTGSIIFGGIDTDKYIGNLVALPVIPLQYRNGTTFYAELVVELTSFGITDETGSYTSFTSSAFDVPAVLDSGTTITYLPPHPLLLLIQSLGAFDDSSNSGNIFVDCNLRQNTALTFDFGFGGSGGATVTIRVPVDELIFDITGPFATPGYPLPNLPFSSVCALGIQTSGNSGPYILGDTFLRSAYVVYDLSNNLIALGQTNFNSTTSNIVEIKAGATSIPDVSGVASSAQITQTAIGLLPGLGGAKTSGTAQPTVTVTASPTAKKSSAGVPTVPIWDGRGILVLGLASAWAVLGGSLLLA